MRKTGEAKEKLQTRIPPLGKSGYTETTTTFQLKREIGKENSRSSFSSNYMHMFSSIVHMINEAGREKRLAHLRRMGNNGPKTDSTIFNYPKNYIQALPLLRFPISILNPKLCM